MQDLERVTDNLSLELVDSSSARVALESKLNDVLNPLKVVGDNNVV